MGLGLRRLSPEDTQVVGTCQSEPELHYEFVPGLQEYEDENENKGPFFWYWMLRVTDDLGSEYRDDNGGAIARSAGGPATHGTRDLGHIPENASWLFIDFEPVAGWTPGSTYVRRLTIDLVARRLII